MQSISYNIIARCCYAIEHLSEFDDLLLEQLLLLGDESRSLSVGRLGYPSSNSSLGNNLNTLWESGKKGQTGYE